MSSSNIPPGVNLAAVAGPLLIGELLHWGLFGTLTVQIYLYYLAFPRDKTILKVMAYFVYTLELVQTILVTNDAFRAYGSGFGNYDELTAMHTYWLTVPIMSGIVSLIGQLFFGYRIWVLSHSRILPGMVAVMAFTSTVASFVTGVYVKEAGKIDNLHQLPFKIAVGMWCGSSALCDMFIAACMTYLLSKNADTNIAKTKLLLGRLIRLTIETGSATATIALITLILVTAFPDRTYYSTFSVIVPKTYANTLLVILNSRFRIVGGRDSEEFPNVHMSVASTGTSPISPHSIQDNGKRSSIMTPPGLPVALQSLSRPASSARILQKKLSFYDALAPGSNTYESRPGSAGKATIQISIHNEVVTDAGANDGETEGSHYSQPSMKRNIKKEDSDSDQC
ncbi:hypothetical protein K435DRAFT_844058 [Dendrothele bispora CBS 962.96]|uniref:DUF6534 domain-containing protein n=1 Tax=Dendrothele bispora (strain CBS 962.96) TaxID=1314807 RepID=A0A4S8L4P5_DENBC|nr:hypothetical protein K435DRAFT_844058 [Dendrothele bispora CBS 962.96]